MSPGILKSRKEKSVQEHSKGFANCEFHGCCFLAFKDGNGYIDEQELEALLKDLYEKNHKVRKEGSEIVYHFTVTNNKSNLTGLCLCLTSGGGHQEPDWL